MSSTILDSTVAMNETSMFERFKSLSAVQVPFLWMTLWGFIAFAICVTVLMQLGTRWHGNYEYFVSNPVLSLGPTIVAFIAPAVLSWWRSRTKSSKKKS